MENLQVIKREKLNSEEYITLAMYDGFGDSGKEFVTWRSKQETPSNYYWGHYFMCIESAVESYTKRKHQARFDD